MKPVFIAMACLWGAAALAQDVVIIGEVHDNPAHHAFQASEITEIQPKAIVFEMLTRDQVQSITPEARATQEALGQLLGWEQSGWPDFAMYYPIFSAAPEAQIFGANVPGQNERGKMNRKLAQYFGEIGLTYELNKPLPEDQQTHP